MCSRNFTFCISLARSELHRVMLTEGDSYKSAARMGYARIDFCVYRRLPLLKH
jgi:hypothetical protein